MNQNYSNHMTNMTVLFITSTSFPKIQFPILIMFSLLVSVKNLNYFPYIFLEVIIFLER